MNERIEKLGEQADLLGEFTPTKIPGRYVGYITEEQILKFAELIVRECIGCCEQVISDPVPESVDTWLNGGSQCIDEIKQHFGVEDNSIKVGSRIKVISGFNVGAKGTVSYIEPTGKIWVRRDGASSDVFYHPEELIGVEE